LKSDLTLVAKQLRRSMTDAERRVWYHLRAGRLMGAKFRRQVPIGPYVTDFVCHERRLVVELDGSQHLALRDADSVRTRYLESRGYSVLRFWNDDALLRTDLVLEEILRALSPSPRPSPVKGEGGRR